jgi:hypothetical protein
VSCIFAILFVALVARVFFPSTFWLIIGSARSNFSDFASLVLIFAGLGYAMMPERVAEAERKNRHVIWGLIFAVIGFAGFIFGIRDKEESKRHMDELLASVRQEATAQDMATLRADLDGLRNIVNDGFTRLGSAISSSQLAGAPDKTIKPDTSAVVPANPQQQIAPQVSLGPGVVQHLQVSQRRTASTDNTSPFALQVILQTDVTGPSPTAFMLETNGDIDSGSFFVSGQSVMMRVAYGVQADKRHFYFSFAFPQFAPETPIVVTLLSKTDIRLVGVAKAQ